MTPCAYTAAVITATGLAVAALTLAAWTATWQAYELLDEAPWQ